MGLAEDVTHLAYVPGDGGVAGREIDGKPRRWCAGGENIGPGMHALLFL